MKRTIRRTVRYPHPPSRVWAAITSSAALARWLMPNDFEPKVGHEFTFRTDPAPGFDGIVHCKVEGGKRLRQGHRQAAGVTVGPWDANHPVA